MLAMKQPRKMVHLQSGNNQKAGGVRSLTLMKLYYKLYHKTALHCSFAENSEALTQTA
jgi:hypothetical protein